jgi:hypothetical protein
VVELAGLGGGDEGLDRLGVVVDYVDTSALSSESAVRPDR